MQPHNSWAFVLHGQTRSHLNEHPLLPNTERLEVGPLALAVSLSRSAHVGVLSLSGWMHSHVPHDPSTKQTVTAASAT